MKKQSKGSGLIFAVVLLFVILGMVITLSSVTVLETKMSQKTKSSVGAFYNSESGVEWALNKIATTTNPDTTIGTAFGMTAGSNKADCPTGFGCSIYLLKDDGTVLSDSAKVSDVEAVRSVGSQGGETQRAIEAAVASGGGGCYVDYSLPKETTKNADCYVDGFTVKGSAGIWGSCHATDGYAYFRPPGGGCTDGYISDSVGEAFVCCM